MAGEKKYWWRADGETRTPDPIITSDVLYQLSYVGADQRILRATRDPAPHPADGAHHARVVIEPVQCGDVVVQLARPEAVDLAVLLEAAVEEAPYWAELWPSARALAEAVATRDVRGLRVLEVGRRPRAAGAGRRGPRRRRDGVGRRPGRARLRARERARQRPRVAVAELDFAAPSADLSGFDLVLAADVLYVDASAAHLAGSLAQLLAPHGRALLTCPWRGQADRLAASLPTGIHVADRGTLPAVSFRGQPMDIDLVELARD